MPEDIKKIIKDTAKEVRHEFDLVIEDLEQGTLKAINEHLDNQTKRLGRVEQRVGKLDKDMAQVKNDVSVIKLAVQGTEDEKPLPQRVADLEAKVNTG